MVSMNQEFLGGIPTGMRWCLHCNGYGSSLEESCGRCSHCAGTGLMVDAPAAMDAEPRGNGSADTGRGQA